MLLGRLDDVGVGPEDLEWFEKYLYTIYLCGHMNHSVYAEGHRSGFLKKIYKGVPQGSVSVSILTYKVSLDKLEEKLRKMLAFYYYNNATIMSISMLFTHYSPECFRL